MKIYEKNYADKDMTVHSLRVLGKTEGADFTEIRRSVDALKKQTQQSIKKQEAYWLALSNDGIINTIEKQSLKREMENITQSYSAITAQASAVGYTSPVLQDYIAAYNALYTYIYTTLHLFDDMNADTQIDDRETFNQMFSGYYYDENFVLIAITKGILDTINIRVLSNLQEEGTEGETALYRGGLYQYTDGHWKNVSTGDYKGARDSLPTAEEGCFFLVSDDFVITDTLYVNGEELYVNNDVLGLKIRFVKGLIYYIQDGVWYCENDKTNWRYAAAFADVLNVTGELPQIFQDGLDNLQTQINSVANNLATEISQRDGQITIIQGNIVEINDDIAGLVNTLNSQQSEIDNKISHLPEYLGPSVSEPASAQEGDFFVYSGSSSGSWHNSLVYRYTSGNWTELDPTVTANGSYYSVALKDILDCNNTTSGYYAVIFSESFFANEATINSLSTKTIYLRQNGYLQSDVTQYVPETTGLRMDSAGNIDANGNTHLGASLSNKVAIGVPLEGNSDFENYNTVIGGRLKVGGGENDQVDIIGVVSAKGLSLTGFTPGRGTNAYLLYRYVLDDTAKGWQICGTGKVAFEATFTGSLFLEIKRGDSVIKIGSYYNGDGSETYIWAYEYGDEHYEYVSDESERKHYGHYQDHVSIDIEVQEGDILRVDSRMRRSGGITVTMDIPGGTCNATICTAQECGVLKYMGKEVEISGYDYSYAR